MIAGKKQGLRQKRRPLSKRPAGYNRRNAGGSALQNPMLKVGGLSKPGPPTSKGSVRRSALRARPPRVPHRFNNRTLPAGHGSHTR